MGTISFTKLSFGFSVGGGRERHGQSQRENRIPDAHCSSSWEFFAFSSMGGESDEPECSLNRPGLNAPDAVNLSSAVTCPEAIRCFRISLLQWDVSGSILSVDFPSS